ncbi:MAG: enoyl-CoA hydratase [Actinobacteria bacterium]|jgi:enoyl-CoA hydratase/carnithine racemase|nr:enoyl-CoA hydratase [Actinomycetota bacterium]
MELKTTRWDLVNGVGTITLSRPHRHNSWTGRMHTELRHLLQTAEDDPSIRVVVITGDPDGKTFCPGADSKALETHVDRGGYDAGTPDDIANPGYGIDPTFDADFAYFLGFETITIAAVNGAAAGVGLVIACWCDIRIVAEDAKLTTAHGKLNFPAEYGLSWLLPRLIGLSRATDLLLTSRSILGGEAADMGLANRSVARADVLATAHNYARTLVDTISPHSLRATKRQLAFDMTHNDPSRSIRDAQARIDQMSREPDYREGTAALIEKRAPGWTGP